MNSINRAGIVAGGVAAALVIGGAFVAQGYQSALEAQRQAELQAAALATAVATDSPAVQTIYILPDPTAQLTAPDPTPPVIHVIVPAAGGGEDEGEDD